MGLFTLLSKCLLFFYCIVGGRNRALDFLDLDLVNVFDYFFLSQVLCQYKENKDDQDIIFLLKKYIIWQEKKLNIGVNKCVKLGWDGFLKLKIMLRQQN